jgi:hypothetical protein
VPSAAVRATVTGRPDAWSSRTANTALVVPVLPSSTDTSSTVRDGAASLLMMVPSACARPSVAPDGADSVTPRLSLASCRQSPWMATRMVFVVSPAANSTSPEAAT